MELVGRAVKKEFLGLGIINGTVKSYDPIDGFFEIVYEDGDSEEMDFNEVVSVLEGGVELIVGEKIQIGSIERRPKKKRRRDAICDLNSGIFSDCLVKDGKFEEPQLRNSLIHGGNLKTLEVKCGVGGGLSKNCSINGNVNENVCFNGFDLNVDISMGEEDACFDGNLNENDLGRFVEETHGKVKHNFDINIGPEEEIEEIQVKGSSIEGEFEKIDSVAAIEEISHMEGGGDGNGNDVEGTELKVSSGLSEHGIGNTCLKEDSYLTAVEETRLKDSNGLPEDSRGDVCLGTDEGIQSEDTNVVGDPRGVASKGTSAYFHLMAGGCEVVLALKHEDKTSVASVRKRGRPKKPKPTTQIGEHMQSEGRDRNEDCRGVASNNTSAYFNMNARGTDAVIAENYEDKTCSEPPDKEASGRKKRGRPSKKLKSTPQTVLNTMEGGSSDMIFSVNHEENICTQTPVKESCTPRKRGRPSGEPNSTTKTSLRRSTRRSSSTSLNQVSDMDESLASNAASSSHEINVVLDLNFEGIREQSDPPPKLELPPSSNDLNIDEISIIDLFSVYSFLRSFSTVLFLSPFSLEVFLETLKHRCPNSLIDSIHFSILHTLKLHMEFLSDEGSQSATNCLRSLNWALLDVVTWPIYLAEYLLIHGSAIKPGFELSRLKVLMDDYYKQSPALKVEILRCLCDDVIEVESMRSELNRRTQASGLDMDTDRIANVEMKRKRKDQVEDKVGSCSTQDVDESADGNSDECCLCKMDGSLICCDGCPSAYHSRCVGITKDILPEGEWFCPECVLNRYDIRTKSPKSLRGAELLGIDPHGRLFFGTCGYLLVLDSCDPESSYNFYNSDDLNFVVEVLKSSYNLYGSIINAISTNWGILGAQGDPNSQTDTSFLDVNNRISAMTMSSVSVPLSEMTEVKPVAEPYEISVRNEDFDLQGYRVSESIIKASVRNEDFDLQGYKASGSITKYDSVLVNQSIKTRSSDAKSEALSEISKVAEVGQPYPETSEDCLNGPSRTLNRSEIQSHSTAAECSLQSTVSCVRPVKNIEAALSSHALVATNPGKGALTQVHCEPGCYVNCYTFGQTAASIWQELIRISSDTKKDHIWSVEEIISVQMSVISKKWANLCWSNIYGIHQIAQQEDCGWCFSCRSPTASETCLFKMTTKKPAPDGSKSGAVALDFKRSRKSHLFAVICHVLSIEERLSGLLSGPWRNASYSKIWRKNVLKAPDVASVKQLLITLESNLRRLALLPDWLKHVDSVVTMGSASHVMATSVQVSSSKQAGGRKRAKSTVVESNPALTAAAAAAKSNIFSWWRGGRLTRQLFNYKVLPHSLASKGGRQGGCKKILGMLYPDGSDFVRRSKCVAWRASVEMSTSVAHLAYQVRELDSNIRWDDLENIQAFSHLSKESKKTMKLFKKVTIRRKCIEGTNIKYLLDFGKRKAIPDTVIRNGIMLEVSASERKKYWLEESLVPLHILKAYEERKLARSSSKPGSHDEVGKKLKRSSRKIGLLHLLSKGQKSEYYKCGHCNNDVLIRDAVNCQGCEGFFHKRHVRKCEYSSAVECTYQCQRCQNKIFVKNSVKAEPQNRKSKPQKSKKASANEQKSVKAEPQKRKAKPEKSKKASVIERRKCLPRKVKYVALQSKKLVAAKKRKQVKSRNQEAKKSKKEICWYKGRRTQAFYAYWRNGLQLTRNSNDACAVQFRETQLLMPSQHTSANFVLPKCSLCCEANYRSTVIYGSCENCQEWFHGEAFGITAENSSMILGFRCHKCRKRNPPICPYLQDAPANEVELNEEENNAGTECHTDASAIDKFAGMNCTEQRISSKEDTNGSLYVCDSPRKDQSTLMESDLINKDQKIDAVLNSYLDEENAVPDVIHEEKGIEISESYQQRADKVHNSTHKEQKEDEISDSNHIHILEQC